jgi:hypothetical protein
MKKTASQMMNEQVLVGITVSNSGAASKMIRRTAGGAVGGVVGRVVVDALHGEQKGPSTPENHSGIMYLALGPSKIAFFSVKRGFFSNSIKDLLVEHPRSDVTALEIEGGVIPKFSIVFADGTNYAFECGRIFLKDVKKVKEALGSGSD